MILDYDKMGQEGYDIEEIQKYFESASKKIGISVDDQGLYVGESFECFWGWILCLSQQPWFMENITEWIWYNGEDYNNIGGYYEEELAMFFEKQNKARKVSECKWIIRKKER